MSIRTAFNNVGFGVGQFFDNMGSSLSSICSNVIGDVTSTAQGLFGGDVVGIDANQIPQMTAAINTYIKTLTDQLDLMESNAKTDQAFKGQYAQSVSEFVTAVKACCNAVISQLHAFEDQLDNSYSGQASTTIAEQYKETDSSLATDISTQSDELKSQYETYGGK